MTFLLTCVFYIRYMCNSNTRVQRYIVLKMTPVQYRSASISSHLDKQQQFVSQLKQNAQICESDLTFQQVRQPPRFRLDVRVFHNIKFPITLIGRAVPLA
jgi:hypothetical protein